VVRHLLTGGHRFPKVLAYQLQQRSEYEQQLQNYHKSLLTECENPYVDVGYLEVENGWSLFLFKHYDVRECKLSTPTMEKLARRRQVAVSWAT